MWIYGLPAVPGIKPMQAPTDVIGPLAAIPGRLAQPAGDGLLRISAQQGIGPAVQPDEQIEPIPADGSHS
jgi:hypothetical protein